MRRNPGWVVPRRCLLRQRQRVGVRVKNVGGNERGETSCEDGEINHGDWRRG